MLITFRSKVGDITMFGDVGQRLLKLMGQSGEVPGALLAADIPDAAARLRAAIEREKRVEVAGKSAAASAVDRDGEAPIGIAVRAQPLIDLLERAAKAGADVTWRA